MNISTTTDFWFETVHRVKFLVLTKRITQPLGMYIHTYHTYIYMTTPPPGFSGPAQLNGINRMHVKAPLGAPNGHE